MDRPINVYCDESRYSNKQDRYLVIGAVKFPRAEYRTIVASLKTMKQTHGIGGEFGWKSLSPNKTDFYQSVIEWFIHTDIVHFRCVVADKSKLWASDDESGFYTVYHQLFNHWFFPGNAYWVYLDRKKNESRYRVSDLRAQTTRTMNANCTLACMEEVDSRECLPVQLADLLIGCVGYSWNGHDKHLGASAAKTALCEMLALELGQRSMEFTTSLSESKFNVFHFGK